MASGRAAVRSNVDPGALSPVHTELTAVQRASVWRAPALRRGILVLAVLPGAAAAVAGLEWPTLSLLPTLTAAAAGLLFGVNAFGLDGGGATWLGSLPGWAGPVFWAKTQVVAETCLVASLLAVLGGALTAPTASTASEVMAVLAATAAGTCVVAAMVMRISVRHPHRAPLDGPRDAPAPPGSMAGYSLRLAVPCTIVGLRVLGRGPSSGLVVPAGPGGPVRVLGGRVDPADRPRMGGRRDPRHRPEPGVGGVGRPVRYQNLVT